MSTVEGSWYRVQVTLMTRRADGSIDERHLTIPEYHAFMRRLAKGHDDGWWARLQRVWAFCFGGA